MNTWVYIDHFNGEALPSSWEALGLALSLGQCSALVFGEKVEALAQAALHFGAQEVLLAESPTLADFSPEAYASTLSQLAAHVGPNLILFPTSARTRELAAMVAIDLHSAVITDVIGVDSSLEFTRPIYEGKLTEKLVCGAATPLALLRPRAFPRPAARPTAGKITRVEALAAAESPTTLLGFTPGAAGVSLADAAVIVAGGRGATNNPAFGSESAAAQHGLALLGDLAQTLGGALAASRPLVDSGLISYNHQVGQTGKSVAPDLYIAAGISGAIQHLSGIRAARLVVAINKDKEAPIFGVARYGVVGDLFALIPALTAAFKKRLGK